MAPGDTLAQICARELGQVLELMTGQSAAIEARPAGPTTDGVTSWTQSFDIAPDALLQFSISAQEATGIGQAILSAAGVESASAAEAASTYTETVQQVMSGTATALGRELGRTVECTEGRSTTASSSAPVFALCIADPAATLAVNASPSLLRALDKSSLEPVRPPAPEAPVVASAKAPPPVMDVLLDVQLPVSILFGASAMPLREVLKLTSGSVVELDREPEQSVDVVVNNCVVARGEVVVVDGNYGVRILEIAGRQQRMALRGGVHTV